MRDINEKQPPLAIMTLNLMLRIERIHCSTCSCFCVGGQSVHRALLFPDGLNVGCGYFPLNKFKKIHFYLIFSF